MHSALSRREVDAEDASDERFDVVVQGAAGRVRHHHFKVPTPRRICINCSHTHYTHRYNIPGEQALTTGYLTPCNFKVKVNLKLKLKLKTDF